MERREPGGELEALGCEDFDSRDDEHSKKGAEETSGEEAALEDVQGEERSVKEVLAVDE